MAGAQCHKYSGAGACRGRTCPRGQFAVDAGRPGERPRRRCLFDFTRAEVVERRKKRTTKKNNNNIKHHKTIITTTTNTKKTQRSKKKNKQERRKKDYTKEVFTSIYNCILRLIFYLIELLVYNYIYLIYLKKV